MRVCVSNNFDLKRVIGDMLESLKMKKPNLESLEALQRGPKSEVIAKKFLLVLDDIWEDESEERDKSKWENVLAPLTYGSLGSKILTTTQMESVALMIAKVINKKKETFRLEGLEEDVCLHLLNNHAFANVENPDIYHPKLRSIAVEIVEKVYGSPLAAKVMGGVLNSNLDKRHWLKILNSDIGNGEMGRNDIFPILRLNYTFLPKLEIKDNDELVSFPVEADQWFLQVSSSLRELEFERLKSLQSLPTILSSLSSLEILCVREVPQLKQLPIIPISLEILFLSSLESLQCLQPLSHSSLKHLYLIMIPLRNLPELPSSLYSLCMRNLEKLDCLPSCLSNLPSLRNLFIYNAPLLQELQHLPPSLEELSVYGCQPEFKKRYQRPTGSDWHKISDISNIRISTEPP